MESYEILWKTALTELEKTVSSISYDTYIVGLKAVDVKGSAIVLCNESRLIVDTVSVKLGDKIRDALKKCNSKSATWK